MYKRTISIVTMIALTPIVEKNRFRFDIDVLSCNSNPEPPVLLKIFHKNQPIAICM